MADSGSGGGEQQLETLRDFVRSCTEVTDLCRVEFTVLGYAPNLGASIFFTMGFGIVSIFAVVFGTWKRTWTYMAALAGGCILETVGYAGRVLLHYNAWNSDAFQMQICAIILGPTLICVAIYLTLKHVAIHLNPSLSRIPPKWYPLIFLPADASCLTIQAIGGGIAAAAGDSNQALLDGGNRSIIAGIALQVFVLGLFGAVAAEYIFRVNRWIKSGEATEEALALWNTRRFRRFLWAVGGAFVTIFVRCIYRIAEMAGGWGNHIMQDEISFVILDSCLVLFAVFLLTAFHPGFFFPQMASSGKAAEPKDGAVTPNAAGDPEQGKGADTTDVDEREK